MYSHLCAITKCHKDSFLFLTAGTAVLPLSPLTKSPPFSYFGSAAKKCFHTFFCLPLPVAAIIKQNVSVFNEEYLPFSRSTKKEPELPFSGIFRAPYPVNNHYLYAVFSEIIHFFPPVRQKMIIPDPAYYHFRRRCPPSYAPSGNGRAWYFHTC